MARHLSILALVGAVMLSAACGEVVEATDGGDIDARVNDATVGGADAMVDAMVDPCTVNPTLAEANECMIDAACALLERCIGLSADVCRLLDIQLLDNTPTEVSARLFPDAVGAGTLTYDGVVLGQCIANLEGLSCDALFGSDGPFDSCNGFTGLVADGDLCYHYIECASGGYCSNAGCGVACCPGTCRPPIPLGLACNDDNECADGAQCAGSPRVCVTGDENTPCTSDPDCDDVLYCDSVGTGQCEARRGENGACTEDDQCLAPMDCIGDDLPAGSGTCQNSFNLGDPCDTSCLTFFSGLYCDMPNPTLAGTCQPAPVVGENCDVAGVCQDFARCIDPQMDGTNECVELNHLGELCANNTCDLQLWCTSRVGDVPAICSEPRATGACTGGDHCQSGFCSAASGLCAPVVSCY